MTMILKFVFSDLKILLFASLILGGILGWALLILRNKIRNNSELMKSVFINSFVLTYFFSFSFTSTGGWPIPLPTLVNFPLLILDGLNRLVLGHVCKLGDNCSTMKESIEFFIILFMIQWFVWLLICMIYTKTTQVFKRK